MNKKHFILLALAANAHVHGMENTPNKHDNGSILVKRTHPDSEANDNSAKRQKTDHQEGVEQIDTLSKKEDVAQDVYGADNTPKKYNKETKQWDQFQEDGSQDECFVYCMAKMHVPSTANAIEDLPAIPKGKKVEHIEIAMIDADPDPHSRSNEWWSAINNLFTDPSSNNNSLTVKLEQPDETYVGGIWDLEKRLNALSNVRNVTWKGKTGNEKITIQVPSNVGNHTVHLQNVKKLWVADSVTDRSVTRTDDPNAQFIIKGNDDHPATITVTSNGALCHDTYDAESIRRIVGRTLAEGRCDLTFGHDPDTKRDDTIRAKSNDGDNSDNKLEYIDYYTDGRGYRAAYRAGNPHHTLEARGTYELTVAAPIIKAISNYFAQYQCLDYNPTRYTRFIAEAQGRNIAIEVNKKDNTTVNATSDDLLCHAFPGCGARTPYQGTAQGNAKFSIDKEGKIQLESDRESTYFYQDASVQSRPSQAIKTEGRSTIKIHSICGADIKGRVESDNMALHRKLDCYKLRDGKYNPHCQETRAETSAILDFGDNTVQGTAPVIQYTAHHTNTNPECCHLTDRGDINLDKGTLVHKARITHGADIELKDNSENNDEESKIRIKKGNVDYKNDGASNHPHSPFTNAAAPYDIILEKKQPEKRNVHFNACRSIGEREPGLGFATQDRRWEARNWTTRVLSSLDEEQEEESDSESDSQEELLESQETQHTDTYDV